MSNVLRRLFLRYPAREHERSLGELLTALPSVPNHGAAGEISPTLEPGPVQAANDSKPVEPAHGSRPLEPASDPTPVRPPSDVTPPSDEETVERQIATLLSAWDRTSLCARREFLRRIDQRIMTTHRISSASANSGGEAAAG
jgi:hypothetical protein